MKIKSYQFVPLHSLAIIIELTVLLYLLWNSKLNL